MERVEADRLWDLINDLIDQRVYGRSHTGAEDSHGRVRGRPVDSAEVGDIHHDFVRLMTTGEVGEGQRYAVDEDVPAFIEIDPDKDDARQEL